MMNKDKVSYIAVISSIKIDHGAVYFTLLPGNQHQKIVTVIFLHPERQLVNVCLSIST